MECQTHHSLKALNTFGIDAAAACYVRFDAQDEVSDFLRGHRLGATRHLVLGGGSNLLFAGDFGGTILHPVFKGIQVIDANSRHLIVKAMAGETWDDLVAVAVARGWGGIENLSLIPGSVGACAVQNIGAYGVEVETLIERVEAIAMDTAQRVTFSAGECGFGYRTSHFKGDWEGQFIITAVILRLNRQPRFVLEYPGVREAVAALGPVSLAHVRQAIIDIRQRKLPDPAVIGNAGSFFKNPVVDGRILEKLLHRYPDLPHYPQGNNQFKLAAGWLIERCGWKGRRLGRAAVHHHQALVLVNLGGASGEEILKLSQQVGKAVHETFRIHLEREVRVVGGSGAGLKYSPPPPRGR
jgi:UDP-N-acetylmuramate dehydrogenase